MKSKKQIEMENVLKGLKQVSLDSIHEGVDFLHQITTPHQRMELLSKSLQQIQSPSQKKPTKKIDLPDI